MSLVSIWSGVFGTRSEQRWNQYWPSKNSNSQRLASAKVSKGSQKLLRSVLLLSEICPRICYHSKTFTWTQKDKAFFWSGTCQRAFESLKTALISSPILAYSDAEGELILDTDANGVGLGAVLSQVQEGSERVIGYYSRTLTQPERQYCVTRCELLALVAAVKQFHTYLYGRKVTVRTDHGALRWLLNFKNPEGQMARWLGDLGRYDLDIQYRPGKAHGNADALSRRPCGDCKHCRQQELHDQLEDATDCPAKVCAVFAIQRKEAPWLTSYSSEDLRKWQSEDKSLNKVVKWLQQGERPSWKDIKQESQVIKIYWSMWKNFQLNNGVIYRKDPNTEQIQLVNPVNLNQQISNQVHNHRLGGHFGIKKTLHNVRMRFWWPGLKADVKRWCRTCIMCQKRNPMVRFENAVTPRSGRITNGAGSDWYFIVQRTDGKWKHLCLSSYGLYYKVDRSICASGSLGHNSCRYPSYRIISEIGGPKDPTFRPRKGIPIRTYTWNLSTVGDTADPNDAL